MSVSLHQRLEYVAGLRRLPGLSDAQPALLEALGSATEILSFDAGQRVNLTGRTSDDLILVLDGELQIGDDVLARRCGAGSVLGWLELLAERSSSTTATAVRSGRALRLDADAVSGLLEDPDCALLRSWLEHLAADVARQAAPLDLAHHLARQRPTPAPPPRRVLEGDFVEAMLLLRRLRLFERTDVEAVTRLARHLRSVRYPAGARPWSAGGPDGLLLVDHAGPEPLMLGLTELLTDEHRPAPRLPRSIHGLLLRRQLVMDVLEDHPSLGISIAASLAQYQLRD